MERPRRLHKDVYGGLGVMLFGVVYALQATRYTIGTLSRMGPGYFPTALGVIMVLTGLAIAIKGYLSTPAQDEEHRPAEWRAWILICASLVAFILLAERLGIMAATFAVVFISAFADRDNNWKQAAVLALAMVVIGVIVFWWALKIQLPLWPGRA
jgi:Tripartite tricarboxylate transporter TctB family